MNLYTTLTASPICTECQGACGKLVPKETEQAHEILLETDWSRETCDVCNGRGVIEVECEACGGAGVHHSQA